MRWTQPTDKSREGEDGQSFRCHWTGCLCFCAPAEGRRTCSGVAWGGWSVAWTARWESCVQRHSLPTASPFPLGPTAAPPPGQPGDAPADLSCFPALWLSPKEMSGHNWTKHSLFLCFWHSSEPQLEQNWAFVECAFHTKSWSHHVFTNHPFPSGTLQLGIFERSLKSKCCGCLAASLYRTELRTLHRTEERTVWGYFEL